MTIRLDNLGLDTTAGDARYLKLDQTTPQTVLNGKPVFSGGLSSPGAGAGSERFGASATSAGVGSTAIGNGAVATNGLSIAIGQGASTSGFFNGATAIGYQANAANGSTAIGRQAACTINFGTAIGQNASVTADYSMAFGSDASCNLGNTAVFGAGSGEQIGDVYFGTGILNATPLACVLHGSGGSGTNIAGANFAVAGGKATGNAVGGSILLQTSDAGASGTTLQTLSTKWTINQAGSLLSGTAGTSAYNILTAGTLGAGATTVTSLTDSGLTSGRIPYASTGGLLIDNSALTFVTTSGLNITGNVGLGATTSTYNNTGDEYVINTARTFTDNTASAYKSAFYGLVMLNPTGGGALAQRAEGIQFGTQTVAGSNFTMSYLRGADLNAIHRGSGVIDQAIGVLGEVGTFNSGSDTTGTITNCYAIYALSHKTTSSTINNSYGLYVAGVEGTNAWDVYAGDTGANNYFAGNVGIGDASPSTLLQVGTEPDGITTSVDGFSVRSNNASNRGSVLEQANASNTLEALAIGHLSNTATTPVFSVYGGNGSTDAFAGVRFTVLSGGNVGVGTTPTAKTHIDQSSTTGAIPVLTLDQADVSEEFIRLIGTSTTDATQSLVDAADMATPGTIKGWIKVYIQDDQATNPIVDGVYYVPFYSAPTA